MPAPARVVLIGDPDPATSALYQRVLSASYTVLIAADEAALRALLASGQVSVVVLELAMLGDAGLERLAALSQACAGRGARLVICSTRDERRRGAEVGAAAYLIKPTLPGALLEAIDSVIRATSAAATTM